MSKATQQGRRQTSESRCQAPQGRTLDQTRAALGALQTPSRCVLPPHPSPGVSEAHASCGLFRVTEPLVSMSLSVKEPAVPAS